MLSNRKPLATPSDPNDVMTGWCQSCRTVIEVLRTDCQAPLTQRAPLSQMGKHEAFEGAWKELWSVECPACKAGSKSGEGPRVYLMKKE